MNAVLDYDYPKYGVSSFTRYLARTIGNTLQPTSHQKKAYQRLYARTRPLQGLDEANSGWIDRIAATRRRHLLLPSTTTCWKSSAK